MLNLFEEYTKNYSFGFEGEVNDAVNYSLVDGGKRIRPVLLLTLLKDYGYNIEEGLAPALAIEMIHTYSLCHDDLPAMDDDDFRRGKLSTHKKFGEDIAILAGDALLTQSYEVISRDETLSDTKKVKLINALAKYASGMIYGQQLDLKGEGQSLDLDDIYKINTYKTSNLLMFSLHAAAIVAEHEEDEETLLNIAKDLGLAFQLQDDIFDLTKSFEDLGKEPSDEGNDKSTVVKLIGLNASALKLEELFTRVYALIETLDLNTDNLYNLVKKIQLRSN